MANEIDTVAPDEPLPSLPVARAVWTSRPDLRTSATSWLMAGGPHHTVYSSAVDREILDDFATIAGVELAVIDVVDDRPIVPRRPAVERGLVPPVRGI